MCQIKHGATGGRSGLMKSECWKESKHKRTIICGFVKQFCSNIYQIDEEKIKKLNSIKLKKLNSWNWIKIVVPCSNPIESPMLRDATLATDGEGRNQLFSRDNVS